ncbi:conserved domain protein [Actinomyces sp. oral taxon 170 str. F0386]|nr:conserved domain protein [Actinomyces sp. oral taxon 170 str. F0386]
MPLAEYVVAHNCAACGRPSRGTRETVLTAVSRVSPTTARPPGFMAGLGR